ncbi:hypothetical protein pb186bvf_008289 [Paramecium bursaria]
MIVWQNQKIKLLNEQLKSKRDQYQFYLIELNKIQNQIIDKNKDTQIQVENQSVHFINSPQAIQQHHENDCNIILQDMKDNYSGRQLQNQRSANDIEKQKNRFKHKYIIKRILNNRDNFSQRFIEVIHKVNFNTEQIVTIETVDTSNLKLNKQFQILKNVNINQYSQLILIKFDLDKNILQRDCDWVVSIQEKIYLQAFKSDLMQILYP